MSKASSVWVYKQGNGSHVQHTELFFRNKLSVSLRNNVFRAYLERIKKLSCPATRPSQWQKACQCGLAFLRCFNPIIDYMFLFLCTLSNVLCRIQSASYCGECWTFYSNIIEFIRQCVIDFEHVNKFSNHTIQAHIRVLSRKRPGACPTTCKYNHVKRYSKTERSTLKHNAG